MLQSYLKIAFRTLVRNKAYASINVLGLALGIACGLLIFTIVTYHLSFDTFHKDADRVYRIYMTFNTPDGLGQTPGATLPLGKAIQNDLTFFEKTARISIHDNTILSVNTSSETKKFREKWGVMFADPAILDILNFPLVQGDPKTALAEPNTALITENIAHKYFGGENPIGKIIRFEAKIDCKITGILKNIPDNTDFHAEIFISYPTLFAYDKDYKESQDEWGNVSSSDNLFVVLKPSVSVATVENALVGTVKKYYDKRDAAVIRFRMQPLNNIHFNPDLNGFIAKRNLWALSLISVFLIVTACVNFVNLATAQALNRSREVGVRKVLGSLPSHLFWQFIAETALITIAALMLAYLLAYLTLPFLNQLLETQMQINLFTNVSLLGFTILLAILVVFLSGSYPGLVLAGFEPIKALKGKLNQSSVGGFPLRRILVVAQFAIAQMLIIGTVVIANQMNFSKKADLGFNKDAVVMLTVPETDLNKMTTLKNRIAQMANVESVSLCYQAPASDNYSQSSMRYEGRTEPEKFQVNRKLADANYVPAFGLKLAAGRNIFPADTVREYLVNETLVHKLGFKNPQDIVGKSITINDHKAPIVGVVHDFHNVSFHAAIQPIAIMSSYQNYQNLAVKINLSQVKTTLSELETIWNQIYPSYVYESQFLDERIRRFYELEEIILQLIQVFTGIALVIGCLGLYGLVSFMAVQKTKEIGIRKVLGASIGSLLWLFGKEFSRLIVVAFVIAAPVAWYVMNGWLQDFQYRIQIGVGIFAMSIGFTLLVAVLTVGYRSIRAALTNPVKSLRSE